MARVARIQTALNAGELSPLLSGRPDLQKYGAGLRKSENFLPLIQGPAMRRGGFRYLGHTKDNGKAVLLPFVRSRKAAYMLEFGNNYVRFWANRGAVVTDGGQPYEIASPYTLGHLFDENGAPRLTASQSGDILYLACPGVEPHKLSSYGPTNWVIEPFRPKGGPWDEPNGDKSKFLAAEGSRDGAVTLTASFDAFAPGQEGMLIRYENINYTPLLAWEAGATLAPDYVRSDGKTYKAVDWHGPDHVTGATKPTHSSGSEWDGSGLKWVYGEPDNLSLVGVLWEYRDPGYGIVRVTRVIGPRQAEGMVVKGYELPDHLAGAGTWKWQMGAWSGVNGGRSYPTCVTFFRERLVFAGGVRVWMSKAGDFENFEDKTLGEVATNNAITVAVITEQGADSIVGLASMTGLIVITGGGNAVISEASTSNPLGPGNVRVQAQGALGGESAKPVHIGQDGSLFIQSGGRKVRDISYTFSSDTWNAPDLSVMSEHITSPGVLSMAYQQEPYSILWFVRADGQLVGLTYDREQQVNAWHRHVIGGSGRVETVGSLPAHVGPNDELYTVIAVDAPESDGTQGVRRFVCCLEEGIADKANLSAAFFVDCGKTVESMQPIKEFPSLDHLEGLTVDILADGAVQTPQTVQGGKIVLPRPAKIIQVGLGYASVLETTFIEAGAQNGTAQGANKMMREPILRVHRSAGGEIGSPASDRWQTIFSRDVRDKMDRPVRLITGDIRNTPWPGGWETEGSIGVRQAQPFPLCVLSIVFVVETVEH